MNTSLSPRRLAVIFNPVGGSAKGGLIDRLEAACAVRGVELVKLTTTATPGSARDLAKSCAADKVRPVDAIIACGGDGTACQAAEGLIASEIPLAVFPAGTGNLFARAFYSNPEPERFLDMIMHGHAQPIDMIRLTTTSASGQEYEQLFLVAVGLGKVSDAISGASARMKRIFGKLTYVVRVAAATLRPQPATYTIEGVGPDGTKREVTTRAAAVFALNAVPPSMLPLSRGCNASDGLLDVVLLKATSLFSLIGMSAHMAIGRPDSSPRYQRLRCTTVKITTSAPVTPNIDGDPGTATTAMTLSVLPKAVRIIVS